MGSFIATGWWSEVALANGKFEVLSGEGFLENA